MFPKVITTEEDYAAVRQKLCSPTRSYLIPIWADEHTHPAVNPPTVLFIYINDETYVMSFSHNEAQTVPLEWLQKLTYDNGVTPNKKDLLYWLADGQHPGLHDGMGIEYYATGSVTDYEQLCDFAAIRDIHNKHMGLHNVNRAVPLMKLLEQADCVKASLTKLDASNISKSGYFFFNSILIPTYQFIERSGLAIDEAEFAKHFGHKLIRSVVHDKKVYSYYYPYTTTGRPSNSFGGINFAALNKTDGSRKAFISRFPNGKLVLLDFESFHLRLIAHMMKYPQPTERFHEFLAKQYFQTDTITPEQYDEGKKLTFSYLYSTDTSNTTIDFFNQVYALIDQIYEESIQKGAFQNKLGRVISLDNIESPTKAKVFNYIIQSYETQVATNLMQRLVPLYDGRSSKIVLYTYDSILIDWDVDTDGRNLIKQTKAVLEQPMSILSGDLVGYPTKQYEGVNYHEMAAI